MADASPVTPSRVAAAVQASGRLLGTAGALAAVESISAELNGLGPLQPLTRDPAVTDIFVNGPDSVWLDRGRGLEKAPVVFSGEPQIRALAARLVAAGGRRLDDGSPCVDVRLDGGYRVHAVLPPISTAGTLLSVRIRRATVFSMPELKRAGMFGRRDTRGLVQSVLERMVARRLSFLISGATGSGKTTLLATLLGLCHPGERLVLIEDAAELNPVHPHVVSLESRHGNLEGGGAVDLGELVRQALRMRPDRLVVGECRGAEVRELLSAMNTGHTGGGGTIHANAAAAVPPGWRPSARSPAWARTPSGCRSPARSTPSCMSSGPNRAARSRALESWRSETRAWLSPSHWRSNRASSASAEPGRCWRAVSAWIPGWPGRTPPTAGGRGRQDGRRVPDADPPSPGRRDDRLPDHRFGPGRVAGLSHPARGRPSYPQGVARRGHASSAAYGSPGSRPGRAGGGMTRWRGGGSADAGAGPDDSPGPAVGRAAEGRAHPCPAVG